MSPARSHGAAPGHGPGQAMNNVRSPKHPALCSTERPGLEGGKGGGCGRRRPRLLSVKRVPETGRWFRDNPVLTDHFPFLIGQCKKTRNNRAETIMNTYGPLCVCVLHTHTHTHFGNPHQIHMISTLRNSLPKHNTQTQTQTHTHTHTHTRYSECVLTADCSVWAGPAPVM